MRERGEAMAAAVTAPQGRDFALESVRAVDQPVVGTGVPLVDGPAALRAAARATTHDPVAYGAMILPLRPVVLAATQVASLQQLSEGECCSASGRGVTATTVGGTRPGAPGADAVGAPTPR
jgi:hypothetical protein